MKGEPLVRHINDIEAIIAGDHCFLKEIFHPGRNPVNTHHSLAYAWIDPQGKTLDHYLKQSETYYIVSGKGVMYIDHQPVEVCSGSSYYIPPECSQYLVNTGDEPLCFLVIVDPPWRKEDEFVVE